MAQRLSFNIDADDLVEKKFELVPTGWHLVEVEESEDMGENANGNLQYKMKLKSADESWPGLLFDTVTITQKSIGNVAKLVTAAGLKPVPTVSDPSIPDADDFVGAQYYVNVVHNKDRNGKVDDDGKIIEYSNVKFFGYRAATNKPKTSTADAGFSL